MYHILRLLIPTSAPQLCPWKAIMIGKRLFNQWVGSCDDSWQDSPCLSSTCTSVPINLGFGADDIFYVYAYMKRSAATTR